MEVADRSSWSLSGEVGAALGHLLAQLIDGVDDDEGDLIDVELVVVKWHG